MLKLEVRDMINIVQFLLGIIAAGTYGNIYPSVMQVVDLGVYGFPPISLLILAGSFMDQEFKKNWLCLVFFLGLIFSVAAGGILLYLHNYHFAGSDIHGDESSLLLSAGVFAILSGIAYLVQLVFVLKRSNAVNRDRTSLVNFPDV